MIACPTRQLKTYRSFSKPITNTNFHNSGSLCGSRLSKPARASLYELLGVDSSASSADIRSAYRRLATLYHPDVNPSVAAHERFQAVRLAAEVLGSAEQRQQYDARGLAALGGGEYKLLQDLMAKVHAQGAAAVIGEAGADISTVLGLEFQEAVTGSACTVTTAALGTCPDCKGSGFDAASSSLDCAMCRGQGELTLKKWVQGGSPRLAVRETCPGCRGSGKSELRLCGRCSGEGRLAVRRHVKIRVPAGVVDGQVLRVRGQGHCGRFAGRPGDLLVKLQQQQQQVWLWCGRFGGRPGDLLVKLRVRGAAAAAAAVFVAVAVIVAVAPVTAAAASPVAVAVNAAAVAAAVADCSWLGGWPGDLLVKLQVYSLVGVTRVGDDLHSTLDLQLYQALLGDSVPVKTVRGECHLAVPPGTQHGQLLCAHNAGVAKPGLNGVEYGHHFFKVCIQVPDGQAAAPAEAALLQQLAALLRPQQQQQQQLPPLQTEDDYDQQQQQQLPSQEQDRQQQQQIERRRRRLRQRQGFAAEQQKPAEQAGLGVDEQQQQQQKQQHCDPGGQQAAAPQQADAEQQAAVVLLAVASACWLQLPGALAAVPADYTNFQNEHGCDPSATLIVRPRTLEDVQAAVAMHDHVMPNAEGHSWNQPFFCVAPGAKLPNATAAAPAPAAAAPTAAAAAAPSTQQLGRRLFQEPAAAAAATPAAATPAAATPAATPSAAAAATPAASADTAAAVATESGSIGNANSVPSAAALAAAALPVPDPLPKPSSAGIMMSTIRPLNISVNESGQSVWVDAGVKTIDLLTFLRHHVTPKAPAGYTLAAFPWFVYQSVAGAVATGTHGSSMEHNSMSNQVLALDVILANGTRRTFTNETDPFLMRAFRVSVGKLGILARVQFRIVPEVPVRRVLKAYTPTELLALMKDASASYVANGSIPHWMNETQIFWVVQKNQFLAVSFLRADSADPSEAAAALQNYRPDNTTVFSKKGDLLALGELIIPADAHVNVSSGQIVITPPEGSAADAEPYVRAQRWLDGFLSREVNPAVPAAKNDSESARTVGARWVLPKPKAASVFYGASNMAEGLNEVSRLGINTVAGNLTAEPCTSHNMNLSSKQCVT
uniref:J domain-containing protein n=1 Tax=Tetradesmus obliquus TaxID=3088 RepID=A0A383W3X5_TETOB|eukprot:jgi/Sobl393_1/9331/SZX71376.1